MAEVKTLIIDEISMVSRDVFALIDTRLRQIMGSPNSWFGGINVLLFGDFYQLPPVCAQSIFSLKPTHAADSYDVFHSPPRWDLFSYFELNKVMRQKEDLVFAERLTRFGRGDSTKEDVIFFESLRRKTQDVRYDDGRHPFILR